MLYEADRLHSHSRDRLAGSLALVPAARDPSGSQLLLDSDPISAAVQRGIRSGQFGQEPGAPTLRNAAEMAAMAKADGDAGQALRTLLGLVSAFPRSERLQILAARLIDTEGLDGMPRRAWSGVHERFSSSAEPFRMLLRWTTRDIGRDAALERLARRYPSLPTASADLLAYAWGHHELKLFEGADEAFERGLAGGGENGHLQFAKSLTARCEIWRAHAVLAAGIKLLGRKPKLTLAMSDAAGEIAALRACVPNAGAGRASDAALTELFAHAARRTRRRPRVRAVGRVVMITGSLGAGGAERQFAITAKALKAAIDEAEPIAGYPVRGPVEVYCRSCGTRPGGDFFLPTLQDDDIPVTEYAALPPGREGGGRSVLDGYGELLRFLPASIVEGTVQLADRLRRQRPEVVQIWQDGSIYATGLAALLAGVPRIALNVRTLPPIDRPDRFRPEYEVIFRSLLAAPNVVLTANSKTAARRYADWLCMDPGRIGVIYNGVNLADCRPSTAEADAAARFDHGTSEADFTLGSVMRFDENKRPLLWLSAAAALLQSAPRARIILVGDGPLWQSAQAHARALGISERVLFVGRSHAVKFWLRRMDAFLLLSRYEGLPNVLVEAQQAGIPVCATEAGGSAETIRPGETGFLLPAGDDLDPREIASRLLSLKEDGKRRRAMGRQARAWAQSTFSVSAMMERTVASFMTPRLG